LSKRLRIPKINNEEYFRSLGFKNIVGVDEVGRGSWAGPIVAAAVKLPNNKRLYNLRDSKLLSAKIREQLAKKIKKVAQCGIGVVNASEINKIGLTESLSQAYELALNNLKIKSDFILIDGNRIKNSVIPQKAIIKGDMQCASIAAASIIAKTFRDKLMRTLGKKFPKYHLDKNKGYGTKEHQKALKKYGASEIHRDYRPIRYIKSKIKEKRLKIKIKNERYF